MEKVEVINGRLDVTWRGKENMTYNTGDYLINTRDHIDTDGNINLFYKTMWSNRAFQALGILEKEPKDNKQDYKDFIKEIDTRRILDHVM